MYIFATPENKKAIIKLCCEVCGVPMTEAMSKTRKRKYLIARQIACKIYNDNMLLGLKEIAFLIAYQPQHHSTVISSIKLITNMIETEDEYYCTYYYNILKRIPEVTKKPNKLVISYEEGFEVDKIINFLKTKRNLNYEFLS
jgi:hypothetical protein